MEVMICCGGDPKIAKLIDRMIIDLDRIPCVGEYLTIYVGNYHLLMKVKSVMTTYIEFGNPHFNTSSWGKTTFMIVVDNEEIVEEYKPIAPCCND